MIALDAPVGASEAVALPVRRMMALAAVGAAQAHLDAIALAADEHDERDVIAADLLDAVVWLLSRSVQP